MIDLADVAEIRERLALPMLPGPHPASGTFIPCPICGKKWRPWEVSRLPCHAFCLLADDDQDDLLDLFDAAPPTVTVKGLASALGLTISIVRANLHAAGKRRGLNVFAWPQ